MKYLVAAALFIAALLPLTVQAQQTAIVVSACGSVTPGPATYPTGTPAPLTMDVNGKLCNSGGVANPTSTLTLTSATTAYSSGQLIANNATAGSVVVPSLSIASGAGGTVIPRVRLSTNDSTSTAWPAVGIQVDLWSAAPTFNNGDRAAFSVATGTANHLGAYSCTMSAEYSDGAYAECAPTVGTVAVPKLASGNSVFWTLQTTSAGGLTAASKVFTLTAELLN